MKVIIIKKDAQHLHALIFQANMTLVRGLENEENLKLFYHQGRLKKIKIFLREYSNFQYCQKHSFIEKIKNKISSSKYIFIDGDWLHMSLGSLRTLIYFIELQEEVPAHIYGHLRTQFMKYSFSIKLKPFPDSIVYFARHDLDSESYMHKDSLWQSEL